MTVHDLFQLEGEVQEVAVGASFAPSGWIGPMQAVYVYQVGWVEFDLKQIAADYEADLTNALNEVEPESQVPYGVLLNANGYYDVAQESRGGGKFAYTYTDPNRARILGKLLDAEIPNEYKGRKIPHRPSQFWRIETRVHDALTLTEEGKANFESDVISWQTEVKAMQKNSKNWYGYHGMALPSFVVAYAKLRGWDVPEFSLDELNKPDDDLIFTDQLQLDLIGNTDNGFEASKFWLRRKLLWEALGESNPKAAAPIGSERNATTSEQLSEALTVALSNWKTPVYCRLIQLRDPRLDASYDGPSGIVRPRVPIITDIYASKELAVAAAEVERGGEGEKAATATTTNGYTPDAWEGMEGAWVDEVAKLKAEYEGKALPIVKKALEARKDELAETLMVTVDDVLKSW